MEVIVTDTHSRMALAVIRELGQAGYDVVSVTRASKPSLGHASRYTKKRVTLPDDGYADALLGLAKKDRPVLLATGMPTLQAASARRDEFLSAFRMLLPDHQVLTRAGDKPEVMRTARRLGLRVPETYPPESPLFPCVIKYHNGEALQLLAHERYAIVREANAYEDTLASMRSKGEVFVSQYIPGRAYGVSAVLDENSQPLAVFCHSRVREYPLTGGPACCAESIWHEALAESAVQLLQSLSFTGFAMVEFKGTPDNAYVLEINPRIWGTYPLTRLSGAGMAVTYVRAALGEALYLAAQPAASAVACRYRTGVRMQYLANDLMHWAACLRAGLPTEGSVPGDFLSPRVRGGVFDWRDLPGTLAYAQAVLTKLS